MKKVEAEDRGRLRLEKPFALGLFFIVFALLIDQTVFAETKKNAIFIAPDQIASPQDKMLIKVKLKTKGLFISTPISGERVEFLLDGKSIGVLITGGDGVAVKEFIPERERVYKVTVRLHEKSRYSADEADMIVACWGKNRPVILIDFNTLTEEDFGSEDSPNPAAGAVETVTRLSKTYKIILYSSGQDKHLSRKKEWLKRHSFPGAPLLSWSLMDIDDEVDSLVDYGWRLKFGIGDSSSDINAFSKAKIIPIIFIEDEKESLPETTKKVKGWKEIEVIILDSLRGR